jgi:hypothetical protein
VYSTEFEIANLATSDGIGIELFSFPNGIKKAPEVNRLSDNALSFLHSKPEYSRTH